MNAGEPRLPSHTEDFICHYFALVRAANDLLAAPHFERLLRLHEQIEEAYMPGGPPMSPVYDSFSLQHVLGQVPHGPGDETPFSVMARLTAGDSSRAEFHELARALCVAHVDLYRVTRADALCAEIEPVRGGSSLAVHLTGPFLRTNDRMLARVVPFRGKQYISDSPYLLMASEREWLDYFERVVASNTRDSPGAAAPSHDPRAKHQVSKKQSARRRQQERSKTQKLAPAQVVSRHLRRGPSERFWLDYVMDASAGERGGIVFLAGVPDRPELLPHSEHYAPSPDADSVESVPPMARLRAELVRIAEREGLVSEAKLALRLALERAGLPPDDLAANEQNLFMAYCTLGARSTRGLTALDYFENEFGKDPRGAASLDADLRATTAGLKRGWFSVLLVERIHLDRGLELFDALRRKKIQVTERAATRQLSHGDVLLGWLCEDEQGVLTLEGGVAYVPALFAPAFMERAKALRDAVRPSRRADWRTRSSQIVLALIVELRAVIAAMPLPRLVNTSGDALNLATARYVVLDRSAALEGLARAFETTGDDSFAWLDGAQTLLAELELAGDLLLVRVNSVERLRDVKARIEEALGRAVRASLDAFEGDVAESVRQRLDFGSQRTDPPELPADIRAQVHAAVLQQIRAVLDQPIPQFRNQTLREVARRERSRPDAVSWLREQERILKSNPQMRGLDLRPLWRELGLEYQGIETDPPMHARETGFDGVCRAEGRISPSE